MNKDKQRETWKKRRGYAGKSRKWAYRRSKRAVRALYDAGISPIETDIIPELRKAGWR